MLGADPAALETPRLSETVAKAMRDAGAAVGVGRYDEARAIYTHAAPSPPDGRPTAAERRTVHLGIDLSVPPGSAVRAPLDGTVRIVAENAAPKDYGPLVILRHAIPWPARNSSRSTASRRGFGRRPRARDGRPGGPGLRRRRRAARERRLVAARPRPDHPGPSRSRRGFPGRRRARHAARSGPASPRTPTSSWASRPAVSRARSRPSRRPWPRGASSSAATSAFPTASP